MKNEKIIVWGVGAESGKLINLAGIEQVAYFADNNERLWGKKYMGKPILSLVQVKQLPKKYPIVISTLKFEKEIERQLIEAGIHDFMNSYKYQIRKLFDIDKPVQCRILLMNTHDYTNVGDHLITIAEAYFFRKYMPTYKLIEISLTLCSSEMDYIQQFVQIDDLLVVTGGGFLGSLWLQGGEMNVRDIVRRFKDNRIIVFPQSMYFEDNDEGRREKAISAQLYNTHSKLTFCFRDEQSYRLGKDIFGSHVKKKYVPDIATILDRSDEIFVRSGILLCIREDKERIVSKNLEEEIEKVFVRDHTISRMSMEEEVRISSESRMDVINAKLRQIQTSRLVVTDRLHCMILCAVSGTPCIALDNLSGKVKGVYEWIRENPYICFIEDERDIPQKVCQLLDMKPMVYKKDNIEKKLEELAEYINSKEV